MTGYLGFDPVALGALARRLAALADEAASTASGDPLALDALGRYHAAVALVTGWRPRIDQVLACPAVAPPAASPSVALADVLRLDTPGWTLARDGTTGHGLDGTTHGVRLAELARAAGEALLDDPAEAARLSAAVGALDAAGTTAFLATLGPGAAGGLLDHVASQAALETASPRAARPAGALLDALGRALGRAWGGLDTVAWTEALGHVDPFTVGRVCAVAALPAGALAAVAGAALARWVDQGSALVMGQPDQAAELHPPRLLFEALAADPAAARLVLRGVADDRLAELLGDTTAVGATVGPFLAAAVRPGGATGASAAEAGELLTRLLPALRARTDLVDRDLHAWLGTAVGPWLDGLVLGGVLGGPAWAWGAHDGVALLDWVARSDGAADAVAAAAAELVPGRWAAVVAGDRRAVLYDLGVVVGTAQRAAGDGHVWVATKADRVWRRLWMPVGAAGGLAGRLVGPLGFVVGIGADAGAERVAAAAEEHGWVGAPASPADVERRAGRHAADAKVDHQAAVARLGVADARYEGPPPPEPPAPQPGTDAVTHYADALDAWVRGGGPAAVRDDVHAFGDGFGDGYDRLTVAGRGG